jgi:hypothetical protein
MSEQAVQAAGQARLERAYRRILACYPRSFRRDNEEEILAVLLDTAAEGQVRVGLAEAADLIRGALRMRLWPAAARPRAVRAAVTLMLAGAAAEVTVVLTMIVTAGRFKAAVAARDPAAVHAVAVHLGIDLAAAPIVIGLWLWLAWANGRGQDWARMISGASFGVITLSMLAALANNSAAVAPADLIAAATEWFLGLSSLALIFTPAACRYYRPQAAQQ